MHNTRALFDTIKLLSLGLGELHCSEERQILKGRVQLQAKDLPSLPWPLGQVRLISFLGLVCAALLFFSTC
jgi:hypothetical protein